MSLNRLSLFLLTSLVIISCRDNTKQVFVAEPTDYVALTDTVDVEARACELSSPLPIKLSVVDNHLIVANLKSEYVFNVYELPLGGDEFQAVHLGRGPNELISPDFNSIVSEGESLIVADKDNYFKKYSFVDGGSRLVSKERFYNNGDPLNGVIKVGKGCLNVNYGERQEHPFEFVIVNEDGGREYIGPIPDWDDNLGEGDLAGLFVYQSTHVARPGRDEIAEFYNRYRKVRIMDYKGVVLCESEINYPTKADKIPDSEGYYYTYGEACASGERIVVKAINSFLGKTSVENDQEAFSEFQIWDWRCHLLKRIITRCQLDVFTVDFNTGVLYGVDRSKDKTIFTVDLSTYL